VPWLPKTGAAQLSATDEYSWDVRVDSVSEGFKVSELKTVSSFYCVSCDIPVEL
jgi:hypothetical protein